jgi:clan AA aspartic protease (TIGR02281 family)
VNTLLKPLAIAAMSIAATTLANAIELTCSKPTIYVGEQSKDAKDTVVQINVRHMREGWQVHHRLGNGLIAEREFQYNIQDLSNQRQTAWKGSSNKYPGVLWMRGELQRDPRNGRLIYTEWLYDASNNLRMNASAYCVEQIAVQSPPAQPLPPPAPAPAPQPPIVVQQPPAPAPQPPIIINMPPAPTPPATTQSSAKPALVTHDSLPINLIEGKGVSLNVGIGQHTVTMLLDTGATTTAITDDLANALIRDGHGRWLGERQYRMANGAIVFAQTLIINEVRLGRHVVRNVQASVVPNGTTMLLGFPVIDQIGPFQINTRTRELIFEATAVNNPSADDVYPPG